MVRISGQAAERDTTSVEVHVHGECVPTITQSSPQVVATSGQSRPSSAHYPSTSSKTLERLRSFKFVKTSSFSKSRSVHPKRPTTDTQSESIPPPSKRRPVCNVITNCEPIGTSNGQDNGTTSQSEPIFKQPSFNPRTVGSSLPSTPVFTPSPSPSSSSESLSSSTTMNSRQAKSTPTLEGTCTNSAVRSVTHQSNDTMPLLRTPTLSSIEQHVCVSTPLSVVTNSQSKQTTPLASEHMQTPTRGRQTTPLVCTPTGIVATPISRTLLPTTKRKFPGPAGLLPSLV